MKPSMRSRICRRVEGVRQEKGGIFVGREYCSEEWHSRPVELLITSSRLSFPAAIGVRPLLLSTSRFRRSRGVPSPVADDSQAGCWLRAHASSPRRFPLICTMPRRSAYLRPRTYGTSPAPALGSRGTVGIHPIHPLLGDQRVETLRRFLDRLVEGLRGAMAMCPQDLVLSEPESIDRAHQHAAFSCQVGEDFLLKGSLEEVARSDRKAQGQTSLAGSAGCVLEDREARVDPSAFEEMLGARLYQNPLERPGLRRYPWVAQRRFGRGKPPRSHARNTGPSRL